MCFLLDFWTGKVNLSFSGPRPTSVTLEKPPYGSETSQVILALKEMLFLRIDTRLFVKSIAGCGVEEMGQY